jgi:hypothetical protein
LQDLLLTCPSCKQLQQCSEAAAALHFMAAHSGHCPAWVQWQRQPQQQQLEQMLQQPVGLLDGQQQQQQQVHPAQSSQQQRRRQKTKKQVLPIQRAAALLCVEVAQLILRTPQWASDKWLKQLVLSVLFDRAVWQLSSCYRPTENELQQQQQQQRDPHLLWLLIGTPPYCQSACAVDIKPYSLEASCIVALLHRTQLLPHRQEADARPTQQQVLAALQQLLLRFSGSSSTSAAAAAASHSPQQQQQQQ